ncbi:MAG: hypothetical protein IKE60_19860 [Reyranella sp.]|jgi:hypothetical protein|uniref:hypothetical protein n=1 Tax=Reyranella sp. TaxID=1929291 RepID=UPI00095B345D|nr:hypothetical protein [Reyranella sp.]MBN9541139.1 hypothetical protein [Alphaproteobacteria bacterium]MBR2816922.1 hypothetical protein [Reyranella sp.]OJU42145.1 MAG: hypothetical protein BGN99_32350 [Alphaproteobacteria bacterium 65-37]
MKQRIFGWISTLIGIVFALAVLEVAAIAWLYVEDGRYTPAQELFQRTQNTYVRDATRGTSCRYVDTLFPHPYVGFVHHANPPCGQPWVNNIGLYGPDYPTVKRDDYYVVLLTGGSVASQLGQNGPPPTPRYLEVELNKKYISPTGKPFLVLNGGDGAWKEPQPFILFSLYATSVDAVAVLGGYNEHYFFRPGSEERLERPLSNFLDVNPFVADENFGDAAIGWVMGRIAGSLALNPLLGRSHAAYLIVRSIEQMAKGKDIFKSTKKTTLNSIFHMPDNIRADHEWAFNVQLELFQKYWRGTYVIAKDNGVKSAFFLQPVPAIDKELTEEEKRVVGPMAYRDLYKRITAGMMTLRDRGLAVYNLADVFADQKGTIYADDIHVVRALDGESLGNNILAARIAELLAETWGLQKKPQ